MQGIRYLLGAHCIGLLALFLAIGFGTHFYAGKLTALSQKSLTAGQPSTALLKMLHTPAYDISSKSVSTLSKYLDIDDHLRVYGQPGKNFIETYAILCTHQDGSREKNATADYKSLTSVTPIDDESVIEELILASNRTTAEESHHGKTTASFTILESPTAINYRQLCAVWSPDAEFDSITLRFSNLLANLKCLITPNFPLSQISQNLLCTLLGNLVVVIIAWSHSLALPQPVSMVHAPRLIIYALLDAWRILILYAMKVAVESIPLVQRYLQNWESHLNISSGGAEVANDTSLSSFPARAAWYVSRFWKIHILPRLNGYGGYGKFDASDHIVLYAMLFLIVLTEIVCMVTYRRQEKKAIDSPFTMRVRGLVAMSSINVGVIILILYNTFLTSLYFHTPLEAWIGLCIAAFGIYVPFWLALLFLESLNFYF